MPARRRRGVSELDDDFVVTTSGDFNSVNTLNTPNYYYNERLNVAAGNNNINEDSKERDNNLPAVMTSRDRSNEFASAIRRMQGRTVARAAARGPRQARHIQSYSNFMMIAQNIGKNIASTYTKLEKLAMRKFSSKKITFPPVLQ